MLKVYLAVMAGGALGSAARLAVSLWMLEKFGDVFPMGTLVVNGTGSFLIGLVFGVTGPDGAWPMPALPREFLMLGVLGGFTTFSSFSLQTLHLVHEGQWGMAAVNVLVSVILCLVAVWLGSNLADVLKP
ncbi:MAG: fluoride efflux transporter CrcB [Candidatus Methylacidiphilales bacterium]